MTDDVAILHDQLVTRGGAERVAFEHARTFDAPILAGVVDHKIVPDDVEAVQVFDSRIGKRCMRSHYLVQDLYQMQAWQHVEEAYEYDTLIVNKTNPGWFVPRDDQTTVWFLHSTPRGLYDQFYRQGSDWKTRLLKTPMRPLFLPNTRYADAWACNSDLVQRRMDRYWDVPEDEVNVIYPPVDVESCSPDHADTKNYYFTVSRLRGHKRIGEIVEAFNQLAKDDGDYRLLVAGEGPDRDRLEGMAGENVEFLGYVDEAEKYRLLSEAKAGIFNAENEDFGIVPIEFFASGTPVIGVDDGFTRHQILHGKNGYTFARQGGHLRETIRLFEQRGVKWSADQIASFAERFSTRRFREEMRDLVERAEQRSEVTVSWDESDVAVDADPLASLRTDGGDQ